MKKHPKNQVIVLKLGGSIITKKTSSKLEIKKRVVRQIAKELKLFTHRFPESKIILLHGAGSFGHPLVYKYKLLKKPLTGRQLFGFSKTVCSMRHMANLLTEIFLSNKLPILPIQTSAADLPNVQKIKQILYAGFIPLLGGDMSLTKKKQAVVISADKLAVILAKAFHTPRIFFLTDVDGVFEKFPPSGGSQALSILYRKKLKNLLKKIRLRKNRYDVTGGMGGKLQTLLELKEKEVI